MLASFILAAALQTPLAIAQRTTVAIRATMTSQMLLDEDGNPTQDGEKKTETTDICSGWVAYAQPTYAIVVTARHCTVPETRSFFGTPVMTRTPEIRSVSFKDGTKARVDAIYAPGAGDDLAFLTIETQRQMPVAYLAPRLPAQGDALFVYGMPLGQHFAISPAVMMQDHVRWTDDDPDADAEVQNLLGNAYLIACPSCGPGDSGGPVFNARGQVVGILNAGGDFAQALMYPLERLRGFPARDRPRGDRSLGRRRDRRFTCDVAPTCGVDAGAARFPPLNARRTAIAQTRRSAARSHRGDLLGAGHPVLGAGHLADRRGAHPSALRLAERHEIDRTGRQDARRHPWRDAWCGVGPKDGDDARQAQEQANERPPRSRADLHDA